jgi:predicted nucleotidyltransferase
MNREIIYQQIRRIVHDCLPGARILLFGSRARGDSDRYSDYDLLIITPETFTPMEKIKWSTHINKAIVNIIKIPVDLLINSEEEVNQKQEIPGHIIRVAVREGVEL